MSKGERLVKSTGIFMGMELGVTLLDTVVSVILARYLAPEGFGLLAFALSFTVLFSVLPGLGMGTLVARDVARDLQQLSRYLSNGLLLKAVLSVLTLAVIWLATVVLGFTVEKRVIVMLAALWMVLDTNVRFTLSFFQGAQRMSTVALGYLAVRAGWVFASFGIVWCHGGLVALLGARCLVSAVGSVALIALVDRRLQRIRWACEPAFIGRLLMASFPFAIFRLSRRMYEEVDTVMLSMMQGQYLMTGWYTAADKVRRAFDFIPTAFFDATLPAMSRFSRESRTDLDTTLTRGCKYLVILALPIVGGICVLADRVVVLLFGSAYGAAVPALRLLMVAMPVMFVNSALSSAAVAVNLERPATAYRGVGLLFNIVTNLLAIPRFGHVGAAATTLATEVLVLLLQLRRLRAVLPGLNLFGQMVKPFGVAAAMMVFTWLSRGAWLMYTILGSAAVYVGVLLATRTVGHKEWAVVKRLVRINPLEESV